MGKQAAVVLDRLKRHDALRQGAEVFELVTRESDWLAAAQPDVVDQYGDRRQAIHSVARLAMTEGLAVYIIRERRQGLAVGLASMLMQQVVVHPNPAVDVVRGDYVDYWLSPDATTGLHRTVADELVYATTEYNQVAHELFTSRQAYDRGRRRIGIFSVLAIVPEGHPNPPIGLMGALAGPSPTNLRPLGEPARLYLTGTRGDRLDPAHQGVPSQLYYAGGEVHGRSPW